MEGYESYRCLNDHEGGQSLFEPLKWIRLGGSSTSKYLSWMEGKDEDGVWKAIIPSWKKAALKRMKRYTHFPSTTVDRVRPFHQSNGVSVLLSLHSQYWSRLLWSRSADDRNSSSVSRGQCGALSYRRWLSRVVLIPSLLQAVSFKSVTQVHSSNVSDVQCKSGRRHHCLHQRGMHHGSRPNAASNPVSEALELWTMRFAVTPSRLPASSRVGSLRD